MLDQACERCGDPVVLTRPERVGVPLKRFCSSRCQLRAQRARWKAKHRALAKAPVLIAVKEG